MNDTTFLGLIDGLYEAALEPAAWPAALSRVASALGAVGADVYLLRQDELVFACIGGLSDGEMAVYLERFHGRTRRYHAVNALPEGGIVSDPDFISDREMRTSPFYEEFLRPMGVYQSISAVTLRRGDDLGLLGIQLPAKQGAPSRRQLRLAREFVPHVRRASQVLLRLQQVDLRQRRLADCVDKLPVGVLLVDGRGRVQLANDAADRILQAGRGLAVENRELRCADGAENRGFRRVLASVLSLVDAPANPGEAIVVHGPAERAPLTLLVAPVPQRRRGPSGIAAIIFISDPERPRLGGLAALLQSGYGLTPAEAQIASSLAAGGNLRAIAAAHGVTYETARTHLKRIFDKTGVRSQGALVAMVTNGFGRIAG